MEIGILRHYVKCILNSTHFVLQFVCQNNIKVSDMGTLTLRLPEKLDQQLTVLAAQTHKNRSELARMALEKFVREQEREQLMAGMVEAFRFLATNPDAGAESIAIAEEFAVADSEALDISEGRKPGDPEPEQWWK